MADKKVYVSRLYKAKCNMGTMENYLNLKQDHGIAWITQNEPGKTYDNIQPLLTACDYKAEENVIHFGRCESNDNPGNVFDFEEFVVGTLMPGSLLLKELMGCGGCKCKPLITDVWSAVDDTHLVNGVPILTEDSKLYCRNGGVIEICPANTESSGKSN